MAKQRRKSPSKKRSNKAAPRGAGLAEAAYAASVDKDVPTLRSVMAATNGGGSPENVPGFDLFRAVTAGFQTRRIAGPTFLAAHPDGGFFSQGATSPIPAVRPSSAKPENVIGVDNRVVVSDTSMTPWRCICHLEVEYERGPVGFGTGFLVSEHAVITAAHVLVDRSRDGWANPRHARRVRVVPGRNGTLAPYGYFVSEEWGVSKVWKDKNANPNTATASDYGFVRVPKDKELDVWKEEYARRLGYFGLKALPTAAMENSLLFVNNAGYPHEADKPYGTLWYNAGRVSKVHDAFVEYLVDTEGGQSGSPVYFYDEGEQQRYVIAIHTTGDFVNRGLRITREVFDQICEWAQRSS
jgi:V8-like Glu-specific endopeptidase